MSHDSKGIQGAHVTASEAAVLHQLYEDGGDDAQSLPHALGMSRQHMAGIICRLKAKGLVAVDRDLDSLWVHLTTKSKRLMKLLWPEVRSTAH